MCVCGVELITAAPLHLTFSLDSSLLSGSQVCVCVCLPGDRYLSEGAFKHTPNTNSLKGCLFILKTALRFSQHNSSLKSLFGRGKKRVFSVDSPHHFFESDILSFSQNLHHSDVISSCLPPLLLWLGAGDHKLVEKH